MKSHPFSKALLLLTLPILLLLASCGGPPAIGTVIMAKGLDENFQPIQPTESYLPEDTIYVSVEVQNIAVGNVVEVQYMLGRNLYQKTTLTADKGGSGYYGYTLTPGESGHTPGKYTAEVYLNGVMKQIAGFTVQDLPLGQIEEVVLAESMDKQGAPVNPKTTFKPSEVISISIKASNLRAGSVIKAVYTFGGQIFSDVITVEELGSGYYGFTLSPNEAGHPIGEYTVQISLDEKPFGEPITFTVTQ